MPIKDEAARRDYFRNYMRERRTGQKAKQKPKTADAHEVAKLRARVAELEVALTAQRAVDPIITPEMVSLTARQKYEALERRLLKEMDAKVEARVHSEIKSRIREMVEPAFAQMKEDAEFVISHHKGVFKQTEYNAILRCLHPDTKPAIEQKTEAFRLFNEHKLVLLSAKDNPRQYSRLPSAEEIVAARWSSTKGK